MLEPTIFMFMPLKVQHAEDAEASADLLRN